MDDRGHEHAVLSKTAYDYYLESPRIAQEELAEYGYSDYKIDHSLSDDHAVTVVKPSGQAVLAYRGTHFSVDDAMTDRDLLADALILTGYHRSPMYQYAVNSLSNVMGTETRFQRAENRYKDVKARYGDVTLTGHSLGGQLASFVGRKYKEPTLMFNKGSSPIADVYHAGTGFYDNHVHYTTGTDPISFGSTFDITSEKMVKLPQPVEYFDYITHSLNYFMPKRKGIQRFDEPMYMQPVRITDGKRMPFCMLYPSDELCGGAGS